MPAVFFQFKIVEEPGHNAIGITSEKVFTNIKHLLLYNPETRTGNGEQTLVIFSLKQYLKETPGSLLGSLGFFIGWYIIAMLLVFLYPLLRRKQNMQENIIPSSNYLTAAVLWFVFSMILIILYVNVSDHSDIRYIGIMALPAILVIIPFCYYMTRYIQSQNIKYVSKYIVVLFFVFLLLSIVVNAGITSIYRRGGIGSRHMGMAMSTETIFEDFYNQSFDNSYFFALTEISGNDNYIKCSLDTDIALKDIIITNDPFLSFGRSITEENVNASLSAYGIVYFISYAKPLIQEEHFPKNSYPSLDLVEEIETCQDGYFCHIAAFLKKQSIIAHTFEEQLEAEPRYYIYKMSLNKTTENEPVRMFCLGKEGIPENKI